MTTLYPRNIKRWNRYVHLCPHGADVPINLVPNIVLALGPAVALDLPNKGITRFRFKHRSDRDQFVFAWKKYGAKNQ